MQNKDMDAVGDLLRILLSELHTIIGEMFSFCLPSKCYKMEGYNHTVYMCATHKEGIRGV